MNDLNSLVTHALSAVRDAQQSVRDGDVAAGDEATPLLANFADVMQGLIALAQTAPQTEDAFDYAQTAMLRNLAEEEEDGEAASVDLAEANDAQNVDGATDILLEEDDSTPAPELSPLAAAFAPLQETIASLMMLQVPQNKPDAAGAGSVVDHVVQAAQLTTQPMPTSVLQAEATKPAAAQPAADAAQAQAGNANPVSEVQEISTAPAAPVAQHAPSVPQNLPAAAPAPFAAAQGMQAAADAGTIAPSALAAPAHTQASQPPQASAPAFDRVQLGQDAAAQPEAAANPPQLPSPELGAQTPVEAQPQTAEMAEAMAPSTPAPVALEQVQAAQAAPLEVAASSKPADEGAQKTDAPKVDAAAAARAAAAKSRPAQRASSTIAERQAARHMQNYQQAMQEQVSVPAAPAPVAAGAMVTHFAPPAAAVAPAADAASEPTVQLPAVALPNLPADLSNALAAGAKRVRIEINPPSLGNVEVGVHMRDGAVFVSMHAENANVAQHIERHLQDLRTHLKDAGLSLGGFEMSARGDEAGHQQPHSGTSSQERLWSDDMLQLATGNSPLHIEDVPTPVISQQRPGSINVIA